MKMPPSIISLACHAMATRFEIVLWGDNEAHLRAAGEEALAEIQRLESQLSLYREESDLHDLNIRAAYEPVQVEPRLFRLLEHARDLWTETGGAFDITLAPLLRAWGFVGGSGQMPDESEIAAARAVAGMNLIELDAQNFTVHFQKEGVTLDLGAIGKGYAIERAAAIVRECGIGGALLHGGTSTVQAIGTQPDGSPWHIAIQFPPLPREPLAVIPLQDSSLSVSAVWGKSFVQEDTRYGHVLDPRTGFPVRNACLAAVACASATDSDALSTALLVLGEPYITDLHSRRPDAHALLATEDSEGKLHVHSTFP
jgi:thiamine biosynthesis lipoprotein